MHVILHLIFVFSGNLLFIYPGVWKLSYKTLGSVFFASCTPEASLKHEYARKEWKWNEVPPLYIFMVLVFV